MERGRRGVVSVTTCTGEHLKNNFLANHFVRGKGEEFVRSLHVARGTTESWTVDSGNLC